MRTLLSQRWFKIILTLTVVGGAFLIGTPYLVKYLARQWLLDNGGDRVQVQDVDFNPFKGTLVFTGLDVQVDRETTLSFASAALHIAWKPLLHRQISVQSVALNGFNMIVDNRAEDILSLGGIVLPKQAGEVPYREVPIRGVLILWGTTHRVMPHMRGTIRSSTIPGTGMYTVRDSATASS